MKSEPVRANLIIEMAGAPIEHLEQTFKKFIDLLKDDKSFTVHKADIAAPQPKEQVFVTFADMDITFPGISALVSFCFDAMPSTVEIKSPTILTFETKEFESLLNDMQARLHQIDASLKELKSQNASLDTNSINIFKNFIAYALKRGTGTTAEVAAVMGLKPEKLQPFIEDLVQEGKVVVVDNRYKLANG
ncbi:hypothetical protein HY642_03370 [Candidatus Woesearchaeota archaeon]|nr:hypothetical protein [Candidatus Woesearchaeota archaeon]